MDKPDKIFVGAPPESLPDGGTLFHSGDAYLLATPERELASELRGALVTLLKHGTDGERVSAARGNSPDRSYALSKACAVLAKLEGKG